ncbi:hypothetical protein [Verminephrobacter eiseniae]|uniref:hypothetical protein n=1 Tax=Verminephrobacter eiseniae TaxID=364317 RepID=UPI0022383A5C|nr:hypothetical protein [Verminephrobacter eiseniae]MCW5235363.1 hypothetical protein [Verminephrobacter eiseniae]
MRGFLREIWRAAQGREAELEHVHFVGSGSLPSVFAVADLAAASVGAAGLAPTMETIFWGKAQRLQGPVTVGHATMAWDRPAAPPGSAQPAW